MRLARSVRRRGHARGLRVTAATAALATAAVAALPARPAAAQVDQLSKGYRLLLQRGIQLQGMVTQDDVFHLGTYQDIGYTSVNWLYSNNVPNSNVTQLGPAPGFPWSRWVADQAHMAPLGNEGPYMSQCVGLALTDEQNLNDAGVRDNMVSFFNNVRNDPTYANTLLYTNNYGGQVSDAALADFYTRAKPDMLFFDTYPFKAQWDQSQPEHIGATLGADNLPWESELRRYRQHSIGAGIPFGAYMQTFHAVQDYDHTVYRDPSASELRFNNNVAVAFNAKWLTGFTYNTGASSLFTKPGGDSHPTALYNEQKLVNHRLKNWSNALVRLKPIADLHNASNPNPPAGPASDYPTFPDGTTTSIMILKGKNAAGASNGLPIGFQDDYDAPASYSWWEYQKNDPYLNGWGVTNLGTKNGGQKGDVIISWFKPLDESFDGDDFTDEVYLMVVNALTDPTGSADDCAQRINLNFMDLPDGDLSTPGNQGIQLLDPDTGEVVTPTLASVGSGKYQLSLTLPGGDAALFKFNDGAPFVGAVPEPSAAVLVTGAVAAAALRRARR
jgi:hypothetical protein